MFDHGASGALTGLLDVDLSVADHAELSAASTAVGRLQAFVDHAKVQIHRRSRELAEQGDRSSEHVLDEARLSGRDKRATNDRDRVCTEMPAFDEALATGDCSAAHVDALAHHTRDLTDAEKSDLASMVDDLIADAATDSVGAFDRSTRELVDKIREMHRPDSDVERLDRQRKDSTVSRWTDRSTGMKLTKIALDPVRDASLWNAIDHQLKKIRRDPTNQARPFTELQIDAVMAAVSKSEPGERVPEIVIHTDHQSACHGRHERTLCETIDGQPIPVPTMQRLCCEAILQAVIVNPDGTVDQICRQRRTANRAQRRMLAAMYSTCAHPTCDIGFSQCRIHHIRWFTDGGHTVLANLVPLCETHHHLVHEGGWNLKIDDRRRLTWIKPDHTVWHTDTGPPRAA